MDVSVGVLRTEARGGGGAGALRDEACAGAAYEARREEVEAGVLRAERCTGAAAATGVRREEGWEGRVLGVRRADSCAGSADAPNVNPKFPTDSPLVLLGVSIAPRAVQHAAYPAPRWRMRRLSSRSATHSSAKALTIIRRSVPFGAILGTKWALRRMKCV